MIEGKCLEFDLANEGKHELVNGEVSAMAGASFEHGTIQPNLMGLIHRQLRGRPCRPLGSDQRVHLTEAGMYCYPDLTVYCGPPELSVTNPQSLLDPKVIFEVLGESTAMYDRGAKAEH